MASVSVEARSIRTRSQANSMFERVAAIASSLLPLCWRALSNDSEFHALVTVGLLERPSHEIYDVPILRSKEMRLS